METSLKIDNRKWRAQGFIIVHMHYGGARSIALKVFILIMQYWFQLHDPVPYSTYSTAPLEKWNSADGNILLDFCGGEREWRLHSLWEVKGENPLLAGLTLNASCRIMLNSRNQVYSLNLIPIRGTHNWLCIAIRVADLPECFTELGQTNKFVKCIIVSSLEIHCWHIWSNTARFECVCVC